MARSHKKHNIMGITCKETEKKDKRLANRRLRRKNKSVKATDETSNADYAVMREVSDVWSFDKDGKHYISPEVIEKYPFKTVNGKLRKQFNRIVSHRDTMNLTRWVKCGILYTMLFNNPIGVSDIINRY